MESCLSDYINAKYFLENSSKFEERVLDALYADDNGIVFLQLLNSLTNNLVKNNTSLDDLMADTETLQKLVNLKSDTVFKVMTTFLFNVYPIDSYTKITDFVKAKIPNGLYSYLSSYIGKTYKLYIDINAGASSYGNFNFKLADINHDKENSLSFIYAKSGQSPYTEYKMNNSNTTSGGWESSAMRTYLNNDFYNSIESEVKNRIVVVDKINTSGYGASPTQDKVWIPSYTEVNLGGSEGTAYPIFTDNASRIYGNDIWWLRSVYSSSSFRVVSSDGSLSYDSNASASFGVVPGFCIQ